MSYELVKTTNFSLTEDRWKNYSKMFFYLSNCKKHSRNSNLLTITDQQLIRTGNICCRKDGALIKRTEINTSERSN